jgi:hypothetical protein
MMPLPSSAAGKSSYFDDPRIVSWSADYIAGKRDAVLREVEEDLLSPSPHPFSPQIWTSIHFNRNDLVHLLASSSPQLVNALGTFPDVFEKYDHRDYRDVVDAFLGGKLKPTDPWSLYFIGRAAVALQHERGYAAVSEAMAEQYPELFNTAIWLGILDLNTFAERDLIEAMFTRHPTLKEPDAGKAGWDLLNQRTYHAQGRLRVAELFIKSHPRDMVALRIKAACLLELFQYPEAAEA